ncbi:hypothetical protein NECAME_10063 [Necator americanus]|uniref:Uncharacterized protein n=1 Tax=Necator americanus TaxID=51031 RepID=W2TCY9_NECAM|nr:hypothetical protein NECAME_10063 [Necator americanus]ETN79061.1 hypothetical protein NECAME_10063 [Necator americanus]
MVVVEADEKERFAVADLPVDQKLLFFVALIRQASLLLLLQFPRRPYQNQLQVSGPVKKRTWILTNRLNLHLALVLLNWTKKIRIRTFCELISRR